MNTKSERQQAVIRLLTIHGSLSTNELACSLRVSQETIRRDLSSLQQQGLVSRQYGCAQLVQQTATDNGESFYSRLRSHFASKADIARHALHWIEKDMVIALDASSTCWYLAKQLPDMDITIYTNSLRVCHEIAKRHRITLICTGGTLLRKYECYVNPNLLIQLRKIDIDLFIFSCAAIDPEGKLYDSNIYNAEFKSLLLKKANQTLLLTDKSKFNRSREIEIGHLDEITHIVSDLDTDTIEQLIQ